MFVYTDTRFYFDTRVSLTLNLKIQYVTESTFADFNVLYFPILKFHTCIHLIQKFRGLFKYLWVISIWFINYESHIEITRSSFGLQTVDSWPVFLKRLNSKFCILTYKVLAEILKICIECQVFKINLRVIWLRQNVIKDILKRLLQGQWDSLLHKYGLLNRLDEYLLLIDWIYLLLGFN